MDLNQLSVFNMLTSRMHWLNKRQHVLAQNVANADTPEYRARDLKPLDFKAVLRETSSGIGLARTSQGHLTAQAGDAARTNELARQSFEATPTGNTVVLEEEMLKTTETAGQYQLMSNLYAKHLSLLKMAISSGRR